ncbi:MAG: hypothetical protein AAGA93_12165 [Actinomycetota bacterium]
MKGSTIQSKQTVRPAPGMPDDRVDERSGERVDEVPRLRRQLVGARARAANTVRQEGA